MKLLRRLALILPLLALAVPTAQTANGTLLTSPWYQGFTDTGAICNGCKVFSYAAGTTTKINTYSDVTLATPNSNPIILDSAGRATIFLTPATSYKIVLATATAGDPPAGGEIIRTQDNIIGYASSVTDQDITGTAGENLAAGDSVYLSDGQGSKTSGRWYKTDADFTYASTEARARGMAPASITSANSGSIRLLGKVTGLAGLSVGSTYYMSATPGAITTTKPMRAVPVGIAESATVLLLVQWSGEINSAQYQDQLNAQNLITNGDLRDWNEPASGGPKHWTLAGAGGTITRSGSGEADTFSFGAGRYAAKMTRAGTDLTLTQTAIDTTRFAYMTRIRSKRIGLACLGRTSTASQLRVRIDDGVAQSNSEFHTGSGSAEVLPVIHTLDAAATKLDVVAQVNTTNGDAYVGGCVLVLGDLPPTDWLAGPDRLPPARVLHSSVTDIGNVGGGTDDLHSVTLTPDTIRGTGDLIHVSAAFTTANNANAKTVTFVWNGGTIITANLVASVATTATAEIWVISTGSNTQYVWGWIAHSGTAGATPIHASGQAVGAATETGTIILKFTGAATADNDIVEKNILVERVSAGRNLG